MYIFEITMTLGMPPEEFAELSERVYSIKKVGNTEYIIRATHLKYLVEAIVTFCYGNQVAALGMMSQVKAYKHQLNDWSNVEEIHVESR